MKIFYIALILFASVNASAQDSSDIIKKLKDTPASMLDIGVLHLEMQAIEIREREVGDWFSTKSEGFLSNDYQLKYVIVVTPEGLVQMAKVFHADARDVKRENCIALKSRVFGEFDSVVKSAFPNLTDDEYILLGNKVLPVVVITTEENEEFRVAC